MEDSFVRVIQGEPPAGRKSLRELTSIMNESLPPPEAFAAVSKNVWVKHLVEHWEAHEATTMERLPAVAEDVGGVVMFGDRSSRMAQCVLTALSLVIFNEVKYHCIHLRWPPIDPIRGRYVVSLTSQTAFCETPECQVLAQRYWKDDGRCECCREPSSSFRAQAWAHGPATVLMEVCDSCDGWLMEVMQLKESTGLV